MHPFIEPPRPLDSPPPLPSRPQRPLGVTILAVLYLLGGVGMLILQVVLAAKMQQGFSQLGYSAMQTHFALGLLGVLGAAGGVGMLLRRKWGWWLGAFYLTYSVARSANALLTLPQLIEQFDVPPAAVVKHNVKFAGRVIVHSLLCWYFFTTRVESYFQVGSLARLKRLLLLVLATMAAFVVFGVWQLVTSAGETE